MRLSQIEIKERLVRLNNLERLHCEQKKRLQEQIKKYQELKEEHTKLQKMMETLMIRIAELEEMIFGKKRKRKEEKEKEKENNNNDSNGSKADSDRELEKPKKTKSSRPIPKEEEITKTTVFSIECCKHCNTPLEDIKECVRYEEDIIPPATEKMKTVEKKIILRGYCKKCGTFTSGAPLRGEAVSIGNNVQLLVAYLVTIHDFSYSHIRDFLYDRYNFSLSEGEIANLLQREHIRMLPKYEVLAQSVRGAPVKHMDETSWKIHSLGSGYAWVMSDAASADRIYLLAPSRGKGQARRLLLGDSNALEKNIDIRVTDCYGAYKLFPGNHQVCWAHFFRKIRDLSENANLPEEKREFVQMWLNDFSYIYQQLRETLKKPFDAGFYAETEKNLRERLMPLLFENSEDPEKLAKLKKTMKEYDHALFTCLQHPNVPCDNNRAERDLRKIVIKRKKSFGSLTEKGANILSTLLTVYWSYKGRYGQNLFAELMK